jgi:LPPG:FO 2-phospho-L-lactate transferase
MNKTNQGKVVALSGGVGGAKLALGLAQIVDPDKLTVIVNTGDDFQHLGLSISPDIDTLLYTLSGLADPDKGWGRRDETWTFMRALAQVGGETWFQLGDADLALHVERTRRLTTGETLTHVTTALSRQLGIAHALLPMTDSPVQTRVRSDQGWLAFQDYFVRLRCEPAVREIVYAGAENAKLGDDVTKALTSDDLCAVIVCPSNPWLSVGPMLALPGMRKLLQDCKAPIIAVSPLIGGQAIKGPTAKLMRELDIEPDTMQIGRFYDGLIDTLVVDTIDADIALPASVTRAVEPIMMHTLEDRIRLARAVLSLADQLQK